MWYILVVSTYNRKHDVVVKMYLTCRYGVQVVSALFVFILMWILLVTLDYGLVDAKHFGPHTKTTFWVSIIT